MLSIVRPPSCLVDSTFVPAQTKGVSAKSKASCTFCRLSITAKQSTLFSLQKIPQQRSGSSNLHLSPCRQKGASFWADLTHQVAQRAGATSLQALSAERMGTTIAPAGIKYQEDVDMEKVLFSPEALNLRISELGRQISTDFAGKPVVLLGVCLSLLSTALRVF